VDEVPLPTALLEPKYAAARSVYKSLYSKEGVSYNEIRNILPRVLKKALRGDGVSAGDDGGNAGGGEGSEGGEGGDTTLGGGLVDLNDIPLLGHHEQTAQGHSTASETAFAQAVGSIVSEWPCPPDPIKGQSMSSLLRDSKLVVQRTGSCRAALRRLIHRVADEGSCGSSRKAVEVRPSYAESPIPTVNRRSIVSRALGFSPMLYQHHLEDHKKVPRGERVHIYVDVSGSMDNIKGAIYGAVLDCEPWVHPEIHLFSTQVHDVTPQQLKRGACKTTGGQTSTV